MLETVRAFSAALDLDEDLLNGDSFTVSYRQEYTLEGHPIGVAQVMWAALGTAARGTLSVHRFRAGRAKQERLWLANGEAAGAGEPALAARRDQRLVGLRPAV